MYESLSASPTRISFDGRVDFRLWRKNSLGNDPNGCVWAIEWWNNELDGWHTMSTHLYQIEFGLDQLRQCGGVAMHWRLRNLVSDEVIPQELFNER